MMSPTLNGCLNSAGSESGSRTIGDTSPTRYVEREMMPKGQARRDMTDASITAVSVVHITKLIRRVEQCDDANAASELARRNAEALKHPNRRVGAALMPKRRGGVSGDRARKLEQRNADLVALAALMGSGKPAELAGEMAQQLARYRPMPEETSPTRRLMQKITLSGRLPGDRQIRKILALQSAALKGQGPDRD
jgi:hypothetical protein